MFNIVLIEPEIPQNTGNIARTCAATGSRLHIVRPMGFEVDDKKLKRAGLDYWYLLDLTYYENIRDFLDKNPFPEKYRFFTTKGQKNYSDITYSDGDYLIFGKETAGLPESLLKDNYDRCVRLPMRKEARSLNLSNSVAVAVYEALRQTGFEDLSENGQLTGREDSY